MRPQDPELPEEDEDAEEGAELDEEPELEALELYAAGALTFRSLGAKSAEADSVLAAARAAAG